MANEQSEIVSFGPGVRTTPVWIRDMEPQSIGLVGKNSGGNVMVLLNSNLSIFFKIF